MNLGNKQRINKQIKNSYLYIYIYIIYHVLYITSINHCPLAIAHKPLPTSHCTLAIAYSPLLISHWQDSSSPTKYEAIQGKSG